LNQILSFIKPGDGQKKVVARLHKKAVAMTFKRVLLMKE
jgi:hypothetical protein